MADILAHIIKECIECGDDYYQDEIRRMESRHVLLW